MYTVRATYQKLAEHTCKLPIKRLRLQATAHNSKNKSSVVSMKNILDRLIKMDFIFLLEFYILWYNMQTITL